MNPCIMLFTLARSSGCELYRFHGGGHDLLMCSFALSSDRPLRHYAFLMQPGTSDPLWCFVYEAVEGRPPFFGGYLSSDDAHRNYGNAPADMTIESFARRAIAHAAKQLGITRFDFEGDERIWTRPVRPNTEGADGAPQPNSRATEPAALASNSADLVRSVSAAVAPPPQKRSFWQRIFYKQPDAQRWYRKWRGGTHPEGTPLDLGDVPEALDYAALFVDRVRTHRSRVMAAGDLYKVFLQEHLADDILVEVLAPVAAAKMASTLADGKEHSQMLAKAPVAYVICTVPVSPQECAGWFEQRFGGYLKLLESLWNSEIYRTAEAEVLCHITYGKMDSEVWVNISVFPVQSADFTFQPILATDLLSQTERAQLGI